MGSNVPREELILQYCKVPYIKFAKRHDKHSEAITIGIGIESIDQSFPGRGPQKDPASYF